MRSEHLRRKHLRSEATRMFCDENVDDNVCDENVCDESRHTNAVTRMLTSSDVTYFSEIRSTFLLLRFSELVSCLKDVY